MNTDKNFDTTNVVSPVTPEYYHKDVKKDLFDFACFLSEAISYVSTSSDALACYTIREDINIHSVKSLNYFIDKYSYIPELLEDISAVAPTKEQEFKAIMYLDAFTNKKD